MGEHVSPEAEAERTRGGGVGLLRTRGVSPGLHKAAHVRGPLASGGLGFLHSITQGQGTDAVGDSGGARVAPDRTVLAQGLQESLFFLLFFRKDGVRNFFFFLDGDLPGDPSLPGSAAGPSSAAEGAASSATGAGSGAGSGLASVGASVGLGGLWASSSFSNTGKPSASEGSSGDRSGRVGLKVAASLSSPVAGSGTRLG